MKKLSFIGLMIVVTSFLFVANSMAIPIYTGDVVADFGVGPGGLPDGAQEAGYYLWANDEARTSWSIRWTGGETTEDGSVLQGNYWWNVIIETSNAGGILDFTPVKWESSDGAVSNTGSQLSWTAWAGKGWDGVDFTISEGSDFLIFDLSLTYLTGYNTAELGDIFIGKDMVRVTTGFLGTGGELVRSTDFNGQFQISTSVAHTPEPGTLLLLGSGLVGLAAFRRKFWRK